MRTILALGVLGSLLAACGGESASLPNGDGGNPDDGSNPNANCPATVPTDGAACTPPLSCIYESGPHGACSVTASCVAAVPQGAFHWSVSTPGPTCGGNPTGCPSSYAGATPGSSCSGTGTTVCDYPEARCECVACIGDAGMSGDEWACRAWTDVGPGPGCPTDVPPAVGSPCTVAGETCNYSQLCGISFGPDLDCENGKWVQLPTPSGSCVLRTCGK